MRLGTALLVLVLVPWTIPATAEEGSSDACGMEGSAGSLVPSSPAGCSVELDGGHEIAACDEASCTVTFLAHARGEADAPAPLHLHVTLRLPGGEPSPICTASASDASVACAGGAEAVVAVARGTCGTPRLHARLLVADGALGTSEAFLPLLVCNEARPPARPVAIEATSERCVASGGEDSTVGCGSRVDASAATTSCTDASCLVEVAGRTTGTVDVPMRLEVALYALVEDDPEPRLLCAKTGDAPVRSRSCEGAASLVVPVPRGARATVRIVSTATAGGSGEGPSASPPSAQAATPGGSSAGTDTPVVVTNPYANELYLWSETCEALRDVGEPKPVPEPSPYSCWVQASGSFEIGPCDDVGCRFAVEGRSKGAVNESMDLGLDLVAWSQGAGSSGDHSVCGAEDDAEPTTSRECAGSVEFHAPVARGACAQFTIATTLDGGRSPGYTAAHAFDALDVEFCNVEGPPLPFGFTVESSECWHNVQAEGVWTSEPSTHACSAQADGSYGVGPCGFTSCTVELRGTSRGAVGDPMRAEVALLASAPEAAGSDVTLCNRGTPEPVGAFECSGGSALDVPVARGQCGILRVHAKAVFGEDRVDENNSDVPAASSAVGDFPICNGEALPDRFSVVTAPCETSGDCTSLAEGEYGVGPCDALGCRVAARGSTTGAVSAPTSLHVALHLYLDDAPPGAPWRTLCEGASPEPVLSWSCTGEGAIHVPVAPGSCALVSIRSTVRSADDTVSGGSEEYRFPACNGAIPTPTPFAASSDVCAFHRSEAGDHTTGPSAHACSASNAGTFGVPTCLREGCVLYVNGEAGGTVDASMDLMVSLLVRIDGEPFQGICDLAEPFAQTKACHGARGLFLPVAEGACRNVTISTKFVAGHVAIDEDDWSVEAAAEAHAPVEICNVPSLRLGLWVPLTGGLDFIGRDQFEAALMAVEDLRTERPGLGVEVFVLDDGTADVGSAPGDLDAFRALGVTAVAGPAASILLRTVMDQAIASKTVVVSPSSTAPDISVGRDNQGYVVRMSPHDGHAWAALGRLVSGEGAASAVVLQASSWLPYAPAHFDEGFNGSIETAATPADVCASGAQAIVIVGGSDEAAAALRALDDGGCIAGRPVYVGPDGAGIGQAAGQREDGSFRAEGVKGIAAVETTRASFVDRFVARTGHAPAPYSAQAYDAAATILLAALRAPTLAGEDLRHHLLPVLNDTGEPCEDVAECIRDARSGPIDYKPVVHDEVFAPRGDPEEATFRAWRVGPDGGESPYGEPIRA